MPNEPKFEDIVGGGVCPECGWTLTLHSPSCMADVPAVEYVHGVKRDDVPPAA